MTDYNMQKDMFDSYNNNAPTAYGPAINGQNTSNSYHVQAQQDAVSRVEYEKPFRTSHASRVGL